MSSLTRHLRQAENHATLAFHPDCPICQQRLAGSLYSHPLLSSRTLAAITAGVLAITAASPPLAIAREADQEQTGNAPITPPPGADSAHKPDSDPGGPTSTAPDTPAPPPPIGTKPDTEPVDPDPPKDTPAPVVDADGTSDSGPNRQSLPATTQPAPPPASAASPPAGAGPPPSAATPLGTPAPEINQVTVTSSPQRHHGAPRGPRAANQPVIPATPLEAQPGLPAEAAGQVPTEAAIPPTPDAKTYAHAAARLRTHVVRPGESLWSIARATLGGNPSDAQIARQVHRLWELNKDQIRTGNPDLLMAGTKLKLP